MSDTYDKIILIIDQAGDIKCELHLVVFLG